MQIKPFNPASILTAIRRTAGGARPLLRRGAWVLVAVGGFGAGVWAHRESAVQDAFHEVLAFGRAAVRAWRQIGVDHERLSIDIAYKPYQRLRYLREKALLEGYLGGDEQSYVPALIRHRDQAVRVDLRLKGDLLDHLSTEKWSLRVRTRDDRTLLGMSRFSLQAPPTASYLAEWLFHQAARREGLVALRYDFVSVTLNGRDMGVYAVEEHFTREMLEYNRRREAPILCFDESWWWEEREDMKRHDVRHGPWMFDLERETPGYGQFYALPIKAFEMKRVTASPQLQEQFQVGLRLLEGFRRGVYRTGEVFDVPLMARFVALCDLFGCDRGLHTNQLRFYYNPITSRLEPVPYDLSAPGTKLVDIAATLPYRPFPRTSGDAKALFLQRLFADPLFYAAYVRELGRVSDPAYLDTLFAALNADLERLTFLIRSEASDYDPPREALRANARYLQVLLHPAKAIHAYLRAGDPSGVTLDLGAVQLFPVEVLGVARAGREVAAPASPALLREKPGAGMVQYQALRFELGPEDAASAGSTADLRVRWRILGSDEVREEAIYPWPQMGGPVDPPDLFRGGANVERFEFARIGPEPGVIHLRPGGWRVDRDLVIGPGYRVLAGPGVQLDLVAGATILSQSPLLFQGTDADPVVLESSDGTGGGLTVLAGGEPSTLHGVVFRNLANPRKEGWSLTGAVTFYESPATFVRCSFVANRSEDGLNMVRSSFRIDRCAFARTSGDAFDADFCEGSIVDCTFRQCGNDAVDVSGSSVALERLTLAEVGDKGVSAGEISHVTARGLRIEGAYIGVAAKDLSTVELQDTTIADARFGVAAYQKKPQFGPASIAAGALRIESATEPVLLEERSSLTWDGRRRDGDRRDVYGLLYPQTASSTP